MRVAIVGAGLMGRWHAVCALRCGATVAAVVDRQGESSALLARRFSKATPYSSLDACLDKESLDCVHVCTPASSHPDIAEAAMRAHKHVLLEKPAAWSVREVDRMVELARAQDVRLSCVHQFPFQAGVRRIVAAHSRLREIVSIGYTACTAGGEGRSGPERRRILLEILPHPLSLFRSLIGDGVLRIAWQTLAFCDDHLAMAGSLEGVQLNIAMSLRGRPTRNELVAIGAGGTAYADLYHGYSVLQSDGVSRSVKMVQPFRFGTALMASAGRNLLIRALRWEPAYPGLRSLIKAFYVSVTRGTPAPVEVDEMRGVTMCMERVMRSTGFDPVSSFLEAHDDNVTRIVS